MGDWRLDRWKNIELGYTLPADLMSQFGVKQFRLYGNVQNAFTFDNFRGFDPEQPTGGFDPEKGWLWPIPQEEIQNSSALDQNPGY